MSTAKSRIASMFRKGGIKTAAISTEREVRAELESLPDEVKKDGKQVRIIQSKLDEFPNGYVRVRREEPGGCYITRKDFDKNQEDTIDISRALCDKLVGTGYSPQDKMRYKWKGWDIDVLEDGKVIAEFELQGDDTQVDVPSFFVITKVLEPTVAVPTKS